MLKAGTCSRRVVIKLEVDCVWHLNRRRTARYTIDALSPPLDLQDGLERHDSR